MIVVPAFNVVLLLHTACVPKASSQQIQGHSSSKKLERRPDRSAGVDRRFLRIKFILLRDTRDAPHATTGTRAW